MVNYLVGQEVEVFKGDEIHVCVIESGFGGKYPFGARSRYSGFVHCRFTVAVAKQLRGEGAALNMELVG